jgi:hypothetical protein
VLHRVQANRIRKYGERYFLVTAWFARADQAAKELERMLTKGMPPDRDKAFWIQLEHAGGSGVLENAMRHLAPAAYGVIGQLASAAETLSQDLARASVSFRRVQRALVANQSVMSPHEYAAFVDEGRKWARTVRLILMALEFYTRALPHAHIDLRNPDAPLPSGTVFIPQEALLEAHTPSGEGQARERPPAPTVEAGDPGFREVFGDEGSAWEQASNFTPIPGEEEAVDFAPVRPLLEYEEGADGFEPVSPDAGAETFEAVEEEPQTFEAFEEVAPPFAGTSAESEVEFEEVAQTAPLAAAPPRPPVAAAPARPLPPPAPPAPSVAKPAAARVESLPENDDEQETFRPGAAAKRGAWITPPPPPAPPAPKPSTVRQVERQEKLKDKPDLDAIIAASLGRTPKKAPSKESQGEIPAGGETTPPKPRSSADALSRDLASLLEKSRRK